MVLTARVLVLAAGFATLPLADPTLPIPLPPLPPVPVATPSLPVPVPLPSVLPSALPSVLPSVPAGPQPGPTASASPGGTTVAPPPASRPPAEASPATSPAAAVSPEAAPPENRVLAILDSPLGPVPPVLGIALLLLALALGIRRRLEAIARTRAMEAAKVAFLRIASHELRTPLTVIRGYVSMAEDGSLGELPPHLREVLPALHGEVAQLARLVEQMLVAARLDDDLLQLDRRRIDLRDVARAAVAAVPAGSGPSRHRLVVETDRRPVPVLADPARLGDVIASLVDNAIRYSPDGGEVVVRAGTRGGRAVLAVSDQGLGIDKADQERIFDRFGRIVNADNSQLTGAGLGLYLARAIARLHGGDIRVESRPGGGSTFSVSLPLAIPIWRRLRPALAHRARRGRPAGA